MKRTCPRSLNGSLKCLKTSSCSLRRLRIEARNKARNEVMNRANMLHGDVLSQILLFAHVRDISAIAATCSTWKEALDHPNSEHIYGQTVKHHYQRLHELKIMEEECLTGGSGKGVFSISTFKNILKRRLANKNQPPGLNRELQMDFHTVFAHRGIVAYSNCCQDRCNGSFFEPINFVGRLDGGINFVELFLNGYWYEHVVPKAMRVFYHTHRYIQEHWEEECMLLNLWCRVIGMEKGDYTLEKPKDPSGYIMIRSHEDSVLVQLETRPYPSDEEEYSDSDED